MTEGSLLQDWKNWRNKIAKKKYWEANFTKLKTIGDQKCILAFYLFLFYYLPKKNKRSLSFPSLLFSYCILSCSSFSLSTNSAKVFFQEHFDDGYLMRLREVFQAEGNNTTRWDTECRTQGLSNQITPTNSIIV